MRKKPKKPNPFNQKNIRWLLPGKYWDWHIRSLPQAYLCWVVQNVKELEYRDAAEIEIIRRQAIWDYNKIHRPKPQPKASYPAPVMGPTTVTVRQSGNGTDCPF